MQHTGTETAYLRILMATAFTILAIIALVNIVIDPAGLYFLSNRNPQHYADQLVRSEHGLWWPDNSFADRAVKKALARHASAYDCVVIGSSHAMQIGSQRDIPSLAAPCPSILNLAVGGASLEDDFALAFLALQQGGPKTILLGVDPWTLRFGADSRWTLYEDAYRAAQSAILGRAGDTGWRDWDAVWLDRLSNLVSLGYTVRSIEQYMNGNRPATEQNAAVPAPRIDYAVGGKDAVLLPDGSLEYSAEALRNYAARRIPLGGDSYKTDAPIDPLAISAYKSLILWIRQHGVEVILLLTPYHEQVLAAPESPNARALQAAEPVVRAMAKSLGVRVIGTYDPHKAGCDADAFLDFMHAKPRCLALLRELTE